MKKTYTFEISGTAGDGKIWKTSGTIGSELAGVFNAAMAASFAQLTGGRAVFGKPGDGCRGPYDIDRVLIEQVRQ